MQDNTTQAQHMLPVSRMLLVTMLEGTTPPLQEILDTAMITLTASVVRLNSLSDIYSCKYICRFHRKFGVNTECFIFQHLVVLPYSCCSQDLADELECLLHLNTHIPTHTVEKCLTTYWLMANLELVLNY